MKREIYSTDLTAAEWALLTELIPSAKTGGGPRTTDIQEVLNAIFYVLRAGCAWRLLPHDAPALENRLSLLAPVAHFRFMGKDKWHVAAISTHNRLNAKASRAPQSLIDNQLKQRNAAERTATTAARKYRVESGTLPLIRSACCLK